MKIIITESQYSKIQRQEYIDNLLDKINKYVTVPYTAMQWGSTSPTSSATEE